MTPWAFLKLFSCALVFACWAFAAALGVQSNASSVVFLTLVAVTLAVSEVERIRQHERRHG